MAPGLVLRAAVADDAATYHRWVNDPATRRNSLRSAVIPWPEHLDWFRRSLENPDRIMFVAEKRGVPVGQIRFDRTGDVLEIGLSVAPDQRGQELGRRIIQAGVARITEELDAPVTFRAVVKIGNPASERAFRSCGFSGRRTQREGEAVYVLERSASPNE